MKKLLVYLKDYKKESIIAPLFKMLEALFELFVPLVMADIIDTGISNNDTQYIFRAGLLLFTLAIIGLVCSITAQYYAAKAAVGFSAKVRHEMFEHIEQLSFTELDRIGTSTLITRMTSDINQVQNGVNLVLRLFMRSPFIVFGAMIMAFTINVKAALIFVVTIPILFVIVFGIMLISIPLYKKVQSGLDRVLGMTRENLTGVRVVRAFNKESDEIKSFNEKNDELNALQVFVGKISALLNPVTLTVIDGAIVALIWVGGFQVNVGNITQGEVVALINYMSQILIELVKLANLIITVNKAIACGNRVQSVFEIKNSMEFPANTKLNDNRSDDVAVSFENVYMKYKGAGGESLSGINFNVKKGETVGVIGGTGSGKTTLVHLIPRFYDVSAGRVLVNGVDVKNYEIEDLRSKIGIVMQKAVLFKGTIRDNMLWGKENASDEEITEALEISQSKEFVQSKEHGVDSQIVQGGKNLSGGQKQRLTIARALVRKPEILILDDSASALDYATDLKLRRAIRSMKERPTVFIVSQRTSSIRHADKIIVLDDGVAVGIGTHGQLLEECDVYREIYYSQASSKEAQ